MTCSLRSSGITRFLVNTEQSAPGWCLGTFGLTVLPLVPFNIFPIMADLLPAVQHIGQNQSPFDANEDIYGNFQEQQKRTEALCSGHEV